MYMKNDKYLQLKPFQMWNLPQANMAEKQIRKNYVRMFLNLLIEKGNKFYEFSYSGTTWLAII